MKVYVLTQYTDHEGESPLLVTTDLEAAKTAPVLEALDRETCDGFYIHEADLSDGKGELVAILDRYVKRSYDTDAHKVIRSLSGWLELAK